jgi:hypothetical protein
MGFVVGASGGVGRAVTLPARIGFACEVDGRLWWPFVRKGRGSFRFDGTVWNDKSLAFATAVLGLVSEMESGRAD